MAKIGKYLYCIMKENPQCMDQIIEGIAPIKRPVEFIIYKDICAAVSDALIKEYDPTKDLLRGHEKVISTLMKENAVIPFRFGTIAKSKKDILLMLEEMYDDLTKQLEKIDGKVELGLKIVWKKDEFSKDIETEEIKNIKEMLKGKPEAQIYNEKIELGKMVEEEVQEKRKQYSDEMLDILKNIATEYKENDILDIKMIFNGSFLVERTRELEFDNAVNELFEKYSSIMDFRYSGPWAPYNFVNLLINE